MTSTYRTTGVAGLVSALCAATLAVSGAAGCSNDSASANGGSFVMGSPATEPGRDVDETRHVVTLTHDFEILATEVTQRDFVDVLGYNPSYYPRHGAEPEQPVEQMSWYDALAFADELSKKRGFPACYVLAGIVCADGSRGDDKKYCKEKGGIESAEVSLAGVSSVYDCEGYRLPTEAEWEYSARAGTSTAFPGGEITETSCNPVEPNLDPIGWYCGNSGGKPPHAVGTKAANPWGLHDMHGNVAEWTWDGYVRDLASDATDPEGAPGASYRVVRGGAAWYHGAAHCRSAERGGEKPGYRDQHIGFRVVRTTGRASGRPAPVPIAPEAPASTAAATRSAPGIRSSPLSPPLVLTRPDAGVSLTPAEIAAFTKKVTGLWRDVGYFDWVLRVSHGMSETNPMGMPDYKLYWGDIRATKSNGAVTFEHVGFDDNLTIGMSKLLNNAAAAYLMTGDAKLGRLVEQFSKGLVALFQGMAWDAGDPEDALLARAVFTQDNEYVEDGRRAFVVYGPAKHESIDWNAQTVPNPTNPHFGSIWVRTWRSKDDVPHILRSVPLLLRVAEKGTGESVREAAARAAVLLQRFSQDIVDTGWYIRSKDRNGNAYVPLNPNGSVADLASFTEYNFILPTAECNPKLTSSLIAYADAHGLDCGTGFGDLYEYFAEQSHYYNYDIIRYFHAAAITNAFVAAEDELAQRLVQGMESRVNQMMSGKSPHSDDPDWPSDSASYLLVAASSGFPLTSEEARLVVDEYAKAADHYSTWPNWDLWAPSVADGEVAWRPGRASAQGPVVEIEEMAYLLEYCESPWSSRGSGAAFVDCDVVRDPSRWGS